VEASRPSQEFDIHVPPMVHEIFEAATSYVVGPGATTFFLVDRWLPDGCIKDFFLRIRNGHARLCIKLEENTKEWLQHHTILSAHNTPLQYRQQARLAQPQAKVEAGKEPLDRVTTNTTHTSRKLRGRPDQRTNTHAPRRDGAKRVNGRA
jgi:hypothetical protein